MVALAVVDVLAHLDVRVVVPAVAMALVKVDALTLALMVVLEAQEGGKIQVERSSWQDGMAKNITFIVTKDCQLACKYCHLVYKNVKECLGKWPRHLFKQRQLHLVQVAPQGHVLQLAKLLL